MIDVVQDEAAIAAAAEVQRAAMAALLESDPEGWSSLRGMMAMLALPPVTRKHPMPGVSSFSTRRRVEVQVTPGVWHVIDQVSVTTEAVTVAQGKNGHRAEWVFPLAGGVPAWRCQSGGYLDETAYLADGR